MTKRPMREPEDVAPQSRPSVSSHKRAMKPLSEYVRELREGKRLGRLGSLRRGYGCLHPSIRRRVWTTASI